MPLDFQANVTIDRRPNPCKLAAAGSKRKTPAIAEAMLILFGRDDWIRNAFVNNCIPKSSETTATRAHRFVHWADFEVKSYSKNSQSQSIPIRKIATGVKVYLFMAWHHLAWLQRCPTSRRDPGCSPFLQFY